MAKYAAIVTRKPKEAKPSPGTVVHNQRYGNFNDLLAEKFRKPNMHLTRISNATKTFNAWAKENEKRYKEKKKRKIRSDAHLLESLAIVLSVEQVDKNAPEDIWKKAIEFQKWFEKEFDTTVRTMDWHRDEGHVKNGKAIINEHIHLEFDNVDSNGDMVRRRFSKGVKSMLQDKIAEIYKPLGFIRGEKNEPGKGRRGLGQKDYKKKKKREQLDYIEEQNRKMRAMLKSEKAKREAYAKVEKIIKALKLKNKEGELSNKEIQQSIADLWSWIQNYYKHGQEQGKEIKELKKAVKEKEADINELKAEKAILDTASTQKDAQIGDLKALLSEKKQKPSLIAVSEDFDLTPEQAGEALVKAKVKQNAEVVDDLGTLIVCRKGEDINAVAYTSTHKELVESAIGKQFNQVSKALAEYVDKLQAAINVILGKVEEVKHPAPKAEKKQMRTGKPRPTR